MGKGISISFPDMDKFIANLENYSKQAKENVSLACADAAFAVNEYAKKNLANNHSVITGTLVKSFRVEGSAFTYVAGTDVIYAPDVEYGTAAHEITPKNGKCLRFEIDGKVIFVRRVHHPGNHAKPFFNPAVEEVRPIFLNELTAALNA